MKSKFSIVLARVQANAATAKELRGKAKAKLEEARALLAAGLTTETRTQYDALVAEVNDLSGDAARADQIEQRDAEERTRQETEERARAAGRPPLPQPGAAANEGANRSQEERDAQYRSGMRHWMATGDASELRAQQSTVGANGGYSIPTTLLAEVERALLTYGGAAGFVRRLSTTSGEPINWPISNNTSLAAAVLAENTAQSDITATMALTQLNVSTLATGIIKIPFQLMQDGVFDWEQFARTELGESYARGLANYVSGASTDASFDNLVTIVANGVTSAAPTAVSLADVTSLFGAVDPAYAANGSWAMSRATQLYLASLRNTYGTPIFPLDADGQLSKIYGRPIVIDTLMPSIAATHKSILFGDLSKYILRSVPGFEIVRLNERYAELGQVAFLGFFRAGSRYLDAGTHPIQALTQHA
jgi:HK97 family phage major capsid protein